jgi:hypothetical protein
MSNIMNYLLQTSFAEPEFPMDGQKFQTIPISDPYVTA